MVAIFSADRPLSALLALLSSGDLDAQAAHTSTQSNPTTSHVVLGQDENGQACEAWGTGRACCWATRSRSRLLVADESEASRRRCGRPSSPPRKWETGSKALPRGLRRTSRTLWVELSQNIDKLRGILARGAASDPFTQDDAAAKVAEAQKQYYGALRQRQRQLEQVASADGSCEPVAPQSPAAAPEAGIDDDYDYGVSEEEDDDEESAAAAANPALVAAATATAAHVAALTAGAASTAPGTCPSAASAAAVAPSAATPAAAAPAAAAAVASSAAASAVAVPAAASVAGHKRRRLSPDDASASPE